MKVVVGLSGGVDSSVAAYLLKSQGYEVIGVMMHLWSAQGQDCHNNCCTPEAQNLARSIAQKIGIPFYVINSQDIFYQNVVQYFIEEYAKQNTPSPCLRCNATTRWATLLAYADLWEADFIATGHYAQLEKDDQGLIHLKKGNDSQKDQAYMLSFLNQDQLKRTLFPLSSYTKDEVRKIADEQNLPSAQIKDSQDLCFLGQLDYRDFLKGYHPHLFQEGNIVLLNGKKIGKHQGLAAYTIGQRKGIETKLNDPLYVIGKNEEKNELIVGTKNESLQSKFKAIKPHWILNHSLGSSFEAFVKIRYKAKEQKALIQEEEDSLIITLSEPVRDITPGQAVVIYNENECLGAAWIEKTLPL